MSTIKSNIFILTTCTGAVCLPFSGESQSSFQNLDFESANVAALPAGQYGGVVPITNGLPGWTAYIGTNQVTEVLQNNYYLALAGVSILGPDFNETEPHSILGGQYTVILEAGRDPFGVQSGFVSASINQSSLVPVTANSLQFKLNVPSSGFGVSFEGQSLSYFTIATSTDYILYAADISSYAGQTGLLQFTTAPDSDPFHKAYLDDIVFSPQAIPEPGVVGLLAFGALLLGWRIRKQKT